MSMGIPCKNSIGDNIVRYISSYCGCQCLYIHILLCGQGQTNISCCIFFTRNVFPQDVGQLKIAMNGCSNTKSSSPVGVAILGGGGDVCGGGGGGGVGGGASDCG